MKMNLIVAACSNFGIGKNNKLPWKLPKEMQYFERMTTRTEDPDKKNIVLMGRKNWESIPPRYRPLKDRINVILSRTLDQKELPDGVYVFRNLSDFYEYLINDQYLKDTVETVWNIGGKDIYELGLDSSYFNELYLTRVEGNFDCDVHFPEPDWSQLKEIEMPNIPEDIQEEADFFVASFYSMFKAALCSISGSGLRHYSGSKVVFKVKPALTLFTSPTCSLCRHFKRQLEPFKDQISLKEIDISLLENQKFFDLYKYDVPVLRIGDKVLLKKNFDEDKFFDSLKEYLADPANKKS
uniref:dihydrofolate reductase n=1 Tax=Romanomermis culicivorax TaxID=13658 RepID=A0A915ITJ2_ROMCU